MGKKEKETYKSRGEMENLFQLSYQEKDKIFNNTYGEQDCRWSNKVNFTVAAIFMARWHGPR